MRGKLTPPSLCRITRENPEPMNRVREFLGNQFTEHVLEVRDIAALGSRSCQLRGPKLSL